MVPPRTRRGPYASGDAARRRILEAATTAFGEQGYRGASLAGIAEAAGITQQGVLYHFGSKPGLLRAVLRERDERGLTARSHGPRPVGTGVLDDWDATIERSVADRRGVRLAHVLGAEATNPEHPAHDVFIDHFEIGRSLIVAGLEAGIESGELRSDIDCELIAHQIIAMSEGLENQWLIDPDGIDIVACFHDFTAGLRERILRRADDAR